MTTPRPRFVETPAIKARRDMDRLTYSKNDLGIVEAALVMAMEGTARATASEVADRAARQFESNSSASEVGLLLRKLGIGSTTSHGKSRFVLDAGKLKSLKESITKACEETAADMERAIGDFDDVSGRVHDLEEKLAEIIRLRAKERQLIQQLEQERRTPSRLPSLEQELARLQRESDQADELEKQNSELAAKIEERNATLQNRLKQCQEEEAQVKAGEARLGQALEDLKKRSAWVTFLDLDRNIRNQNAELEDLLRQLAEKRSLFQRVFGSNKGR